VTNASGVAQFGNPMAGGFSLFFKFGRPIETFSVTTSAWQYDVVLCKAGGDGVLVALLAADRDAEADLQKKVADLAHDLSETWGAAVAAGVPLSLMTGVPGHSCN
jgi:hypothetical protein